MRARAMGAVLVILGLLIIATPRAIFPVCGMGPGASAESRAGVHACHKTMKAETVLGAAAILAGFIPILWPGGKQILAASVAALVIAVLAALFPLYITGMCRMATMPCRMGTLPALVTLAILTGATGAAGFFLSRKTP
jgi:hypothetical protein